MRRNLTGRPLVASLAFSGIVIGLIAVSSSTQALREQLGGTGVLLTLLLFVLYLWAAVWVMDKLPHRSESRRDLLPGAALLALGTQGIHLVVVLYLAPKLGRSSELYGALGAATVIRSTFRLLRGAGNATSGVAESIAVSVSVRRA